MKYICYIKIMFELFETIKTVFKDIIYVLERHIYMN